MAATSSRIRRRRLSGYESGEQCGCFSESIQSHRQVLCFATVFESRVTVTPSLRTITSFWAPKENRMPFICATRALKNARHLQAVAPHITLAGHHQGRRSSASDRFNLASTGSCTTLPLRNLGESTISICGYEAKRVNRTYPYETRKLAFRCPCVVQTAIGTTFTPDGLSARLTYRGVVCRDRADSA
jgi:hypothetical protein